MENKIMGYEATAHNQIVCATPPAAVKTSRIQPERYVQCWLKFVEYY
jgi:hypothetical protein